VSSSTNYLKQIARFGAFMMVGALIGLAGAPLLERTLADAHNAVQHGSPPTRVAPRPGDKNVR
jgi:hypothetical protein